MLLRAGSLAAPLYIVEQRTVGPSLGQDNIDRGVRALIIGLLATFVFMAVYYRRFGMIANVVLLSNVVLLAALLSMLRLRSRCRASRASCSRWAWPWTPTS